MSAIVGRGGPAPLEFVTRLEDADASPEDHFLTGSMKSDEGLAPGDVAATAQYREIVKVLWKQLHAVKRAEDPQWTYGATKVMGYFGSTNHKLFEALFRGTSWASPSLIFAMAAKLNVSLVAVAPGQEAVHEAGRVALQLREVTQALAGSANRLGEALQLREATENVRESAARRLAEAQEQARVQRKQ